MPEIIDAARLPPVIHIEAGAFPLNLTPSEQALTIATEFAIPDDDDGSMLQVAADEVRDALARHDQLEAVRKKLLEPFDNGRKMVQSWFVGPEALWKEIADIYSGKARDRRRLLEDRRRAAQAKIDEEARQARAAAEAKAAKERADAAKAAEELQRKAREAEAAGRAGEAAKLAVQAENKLEQGEVRAQAAVIDASVRAPSVVLPSVPKTAGLNSRKTYDIEEDVDALQLAAFVVANPMFKNLILPNRTALRSLAIAQKDAFAIPGCTLKVTEQLVRARA